MDRKEITGKLYEALTYYYAKKTFSVHKEVGVIPWGRSRLDALCIDFPGNFVGVEIKSCLADYRTDAKWRNYLEYVNQMYFLFPPSVMSSRKFPEIKAELKAEGVGILALSAKGLLYCAQKAKKRPLAITRKYAMYRKLAWREGDSKRNIKRTKRIYLT